VPIGWNLANEVRISTRDVESPDAQSNIATQTTTIVTPTVDLLIDKSLSSSSAEPIPGAEIEYYINFANNGNIPASNVIITDILPPELSYLSWYGYAYNNPDYVDLDEAIMPAVSAGQVSWDLGTVYAGASGHIYMQVRISEMMTPDLDLVNSVVITTSHVDVNTSNNIDSTGDVVQRKRQDMNIQKTLQSDPGAPSGEVQYQLMFKNEENAPAHNVRITDTLPLNMLFVDWSAHPNNLDHDLLNRPITATINGNEIVWPIGTVLPQEQDAIYVRAYISDTVAANTRLTNTVAISTSDPDTDNTDDSVDYGFNVAWPSWDLQLTQNRPTSGSDLPLAGGLLDYWLSVNNASNLPAHDVVLTNTLPLNTSFVDWSSINGQINYTVFGQPVTPTLAAGQVIWHLETVPAGASGNLYFTVQISPTAQVRDGLCNHAQIATSDLDFDPRNDVLTHTTSIYEPTHDVYVSKSLQSISGAPGGTMSYAISFGNKGNTDAQKVIVVDTLPPTLSLANWSGGAYTLTQAGDQLIWDIGTLSPYDSGTIELDVLISDSTNPGDIIENRVAISTTNTDWDHSNNTARYTTTVQPRIRDLSISKNSIGIPGAPDGEVEYGISFENYGNWAASDVMLIDTLPDHTGFVSWYGALFATS
jgi:uncharacterized repeat protein (TIGR01451 family)